MDENSSEDRIAFADFLVGRSRIVADSILSSHEEDICEDQEESESHESERNLRGLLRMNMERASLQFADDNQA